MEHAKQKFISHFLFVGEQCGKAEEALTFYMSLFKHSRLLHIERWSGAGFVQIVLVKIPEAG